MQKVIFVTISMRGGGTERVIAILANCMVRMGYDVTIMMIAESEIDYELDSRIRCICISDITNGSLLGRMKRIYNMRAEIKKDQDAYVIGMGTVASMFTVMSVIGLKNKVVVSERNDPSVFNGKPITVLEETLRNCLYMLSKKIVLQTVDTIEIFPPILQKKCVVIANPLPKKMPNPGNYDDRENTILDIGRLIPSKNHQMLIKTFSVFHKKYPQYKLLIFGEGSERDNLTNLITELALQDYVEIRGFSSTIYDELQKGGIYVSTSISEGLSNSLVEALAMGIPTVATDCPVGGPRSCIRDGENGFLIRINDDKQLLERLELLASDRSVGRKISSNSLSVRALYSDECISKLWLQLFE